LATPTATALIAPGRQMSYGQLRQQARQFGARLQARGVVPNQLVAVMMERGWEQVVATLAILYAGGAYLPIDPALPEQRVRHILERAEARWVLTQPGLDVGGEWSSQVAIITVSDTDESDTDKNIGPELQAVATGPGDLAYVIY
ncbi:AMP-binding protein, partial [Pseudomonas gingeri]